MAPTATASVLADPAVVDLDLDFTLDVRVIEAAAPIPNLLASTSDNCGSTCSGTACPSFVGDPT